MLGHINQLISFLICLAFLSRFALSDSFYFERNPQSQDVEEGKSLTLACSVNANESIKYYWIKDGIPLDTNPENGRYQLKMESDLYIPHVDYQLDSGSYECQALNVSSNFVRSSSPANINVYSLNPVVEIKTIPADLASIKLGSRVLLRCEAHATPPVMPVNIIWYKDGSDRMPNTEKKPNGDLDIKSFDSPNFGTYSCVVHHPAGFAVSQKSLFLQANEDDRFYDSKIRYVEPNYWKLHSTHKIKCSGATPLSDDEPMSYHWTYTKNLNGTFEHANRLDSRLIKVDHDSLVIKDFTPELNNYYKCFITRILSDTEVTFIHRTEIAHLESINLNNFSPVLRRNKPFPAILQNPLMIRYYSEFTPQQSFINERISQPLPRARWFSEKSQKYIPSKNEDPSSSVYTDPSGYSINFNSVSFEDAGKYQFSLENEAGLQKVDFDLIVVYKPDVKPTHLNSQIDEGDRFEMICTEAKLPDPGHTINWFKDGKLIPDESKNRIQIPSVTPQHQGVYNCTVKVDGITPILSGNLYNLNVKGKLRIVEPSQPLVFLEYGKAGKVPCVVSGFGNIRVQWYRGNERLLVENTQSPDRSYYIDKVKESDSGDYQCDALTDYKNARTSKQVKVIVGESPKINKISEETYVKVGSEIKLDCEAEGQPKPQIFWIVRNETYKAMTSNPVEKPVKVFNNGTLKRERASLEDSGVYRCVSKNSFGFEDTREVNVTVLTENVYFRRINGDSNSRMSKMVAIVVGCALLYLAFMLVITIFCSLGMIRNKRSGSSYPKGFEHRNQLLPTTTTTNFQGALMGQNDVNDMSKGSYYPMINQNGGSCLSSQSGVQSIGNQGYSLITDSNGYTDANQLNAHNSSNNYQNTTPSSQHNLAKCNTIVSNLAYN